MIKKLAFCISLSLITLMIIASASMADPVAYTSFKDATITGVTQDPSWADGVLSYKVCVDSGATITIAGQGTYSINYIFGFYALGATQSTVFSASGSDQGAWRWDSNTNNGYVFGWEENGIADRLTPGNCKTLTYSAFNVPVGAQILTGLHVSYDSPAQGDFYKTTLPVPEVPGSLVMGLGSAITAGLALLRRRLYS